MATSLPELSNYLSTVLTRPIKLGLKPEMLRRIQIFAELKDAQLAHLANVDSSLLKISAASFERLTGEAPALSTPHSCKPPPARRAAQTKVALQIPARTDRTSRGDGLARQIRARLFCGPLIPVPFGNCAK